MSADPADPLTADRSQMADILDLILRWLSVFDGKYYSMAFSLAFLKLFSTPGMKRSELALYLENRAKISRSTAERVISDAAEGGLIEITDPPGVPGLRIYLSPVLEAHCARMLDMATALDAKTEGETAQDDSERLTMFNLKPR
jgi:hypothetical protein